MEVRDRVRELRRVPARELVPNPRNWRRHPVGQQAALRGVLAEIGYADALLVRELADGSLQLIDGHLRAETTPDQVVPVLVLDVDEHEGDKLLLTLDPLASLAETDQVSMAALWERVDIEQAAVQEMIQQMTDVAGEDAELRDAEEVPEVYVGPLHQLLVECGDESRQQELFERLQAEGWKCRVLML